MHQITPIRTYIFKNFPGVTPTDPGVTPPTSKTGEMLNPLPKLPLDKRPPSHFFRASAAAAHNIRFPLCVKLEPTLYHARVGLCPIILTSWDDGAWGQYRPTGRSVRPFQIFGGMGNSGQ